MNTISIALHVTAAAVLVGPQLLMFFAVVPATWFIEDDERLKRAVLGTIARRFGMMAGISLGVLLVTGIYQYMQVPEEIRSSPSYPFAGLFLTKMAMLVLLVFLMAVHAMRYARQINALSDEVIAGRGDADELSRLRLRSLTFSLAILVTSLLVLWAGVALGHHEYSWVPRGG